MEQNQNKHGVFISYCHEDEELVTPVVQLISAMRSDYVFYDITSLKAGKKWETQLLGALDECDVLVLFWCRHSAISQYVKKEYNRAIKLKKDVLPILLELNQDMPSKIRKYQWIDFTKVIKHSVAGPKIFYNIEAAGKTQIDYNRGSNPRNVVFPEKAINEQTQQKPVVQNVRKTIIMFGLIALIGLSFIVFKASIVLKILLYALLIIVGLFILLILAFLISEKIKDVRVRYIEAPKRIKKMRHTSLDNEAAAKLLLLELDKKFKST